MYAFPRIVSLTAIPIRNPIIFFYIPHSCLRFVILPYLLYYTALYNSKFCSKYARPLNPLDLVWSHLASIPPTLRQKNDEILIADTFLISNVLQKMSLSRAARIILVGAPGVGKGTQTERLMKRFPELSSISSGDLLRLNVRNRTPLGIQAESKMKVGALVSDSMILRLIINELTNRGWLTSDAIRPYTVYTSSISMESNDTVDSVFIPSPLRAQKYNYSDSPSASFILDGFPRTAAQASQLDDLIPINLVINISTPTDIIIDRICNRWVHAPSGRVYNTTFNAPKIEGKDDITGEPLTRREDDDPEVWKARLKSFEETSLPLLEHYDKLGVLWTVKGNSSDEITPRLFKEFGKRFGVLEN